MTTLNTTSPRRVRVFVRVLVLSLLVSASVGLAGCTKDKASSESTMTYKYDPLTQPESTTAKKDEPEKKSSRRPSSTSASSAPTTYIVQIGAFTKKENAEQLLGQLKAKDYPVFLKTLDHKDMGQMYLVRLTPFTERAEADRFKAQLIDNEKLKPTIIIPKY